MFVILMYSFIHSRTLIRNTPKRSANHLAVCTSGKSFSAKAQMGHKPADSNASNDVKKLARTKISGRCCLLFYIELIGDDFH